MTTSALVLSGGSALGLAHLGVIQSLQNAGYQFDAVYGVSAGSIVGAGIAAGFSPDRILQILHDSNLLKLFADFSPHRGGFVKGDKLRQHFDTIFGHQTIDQLPVPFRAGATDFATGQYVSIDRGLVADALRASMSLPMVFEPFDHPEYPNRLVDGGLTHNLPIQDALATYTGDRIIAINVQSVYPLPDDFDQRRLFGWKKDTYKYLRRSFTIMVNAQHQQIDDPRVQMISPDLSGFDFASVRKKDIDGLVEAGREAGDAFVQSQA